MAQARNAVQRIEKALKAKLDPGTTTDSVWDRIEETERQRFYPAGEYSDGKREFCQRQLGLLAQILHDQVPEAVRIEKDF
jgi:hypothetical protein